MVALTLVMLTDGVWLDLTSAVRVVNGIVVFF